MVPKKIGERTLSPEEEPLVSPENGHNSEVLSCPKCGAISTKNGSPFTPNGLKMHELTCGRTRKSKKKALREVSEPEEVFDLGEESQPRRDVRFPSPADLLADTLRKVRCPKIPAIIALCDYKGFTMEGLYESLKSVGVGRSVIQPALDLWSEHTHEEFPEKAIIELGLDVEEEEYENRRGYGRRQRRSSNFFDREEDEQFTLGREIGRLSEQVSNLSQGGGNNGADSELRREVQELRKELRESEKERLEDKLQSLEDKISDLKVQSSAHTVEEKKVEMLERVLVSLFSDGPLIEKEIPQRQRSEIPSTIHELIPEEMRE